MLVDVGGTVAAGDPLAVLDATDAKTALDEATLAEKDADTKIREAEVAKREYEAERRGQEATLDQSRKALDRAKAQAERGAISQEALEAAQSKFDLARAQIEKLDISLQKADIGSELARKAKDKAKLERERAERDVAYAVVKAPIGGVIAKRQGKLGSLTSNAVPLFDLYDPKTVVVTVQVTQRDLPSLRAGLPAEVRSEAWPNKTFPGRVAVVSPVVDPTAGTVAIRVALDDGSALQPGLFVTGRIVLDTRGGALTVPRKAILYERERPFVFKIDASSGTPRVTRVWFREGLAGRDEVEVLPDGGASALGESDKIVLVGQDRLRDGDVVELEAPSTRTSSSVAPCRIPRPKTAPSLIPDSPASS
jgi:RND family efflux transporter MFP subunit